MVIDAREGAGKSLKTLARVTKCGAAQPLLSHVLLSPVSWASDPLLLQSSEERPARRARSARRRRAAP
jgi:hypothetical protein